MKKFIVLSLAGVLIFALGATVYAQAPKLEFRASGFIDVQTFIGSNVPQYNSNPGNFQTSSDLYAVVNPNYAGAVFGGVGYGSKGYNRTDSHWESRAHLKFDAIMGPNLSGTIYFEIDTFRGGSTWSPFNGNGREANSFGAWTTDRTAVEVKNIYIDVGLPYFGIPVPITVRVGAQPIGIRPQMLVYSDGFGVTASAKIDPVQLNFYYAKPLEGLDFAADDADVYGMMVSAKLGTFTAGAYGLWYNMNTYPFWVPQTAGLPAGLPALLTPVIIGSYQSSMYWLGLYGDGKAGPLNINFDFVYDFGNVESKLGFPVPKVAYQGWATRAKIDYPWEKFNFGGVFMYASGNNAAHTSPSGLPGSQTYRGTFSSTARGYVVPPGSEQGPANGESMVVYSMEPGATGGYGIANMSNYGMMSRGGFGGTWFAKVYGSAKFTPWYKMTVNALYIGDTTSHGDTFGNSVWNGPVGLTGTVLKNHNSIGWEFDLINEIWIYQNLRLFMGFGYLVAGSAMDIRQGIPIGGATGYTNASPMNPWAFRTRLIYTF
jgi:hypothetical protein